MGEFYACLINRNIRNIKVAWYIDQWNIIYPLIIFLKLWYVLTKTLERIPYRHFLDKLLCPFHLSGMYFHILSSIQDLINIHQASVKPPIIINISMFTHCHIRIFLSWILKRKGIRLKGFSWYCLSSKYQFCNVELLNNI